MNVATFSEPLSLKNVQITDNFWSKYIDLVREVVIPYQWEALNDRIPDAEPSYAIRNFRIAAGEITGKFNGMVFQDSDLGKWIEAVGYSLETHKNSELEAITDEVIELIEKAQMEDGYLNTYFTLAEPGKRWTNLYECHELYCAGHMIEAAVAYYHATGKKKFLEIMCRVADHIDSVFGDEPGKLQGYDGHEEIELALVKLYKATHEDKYLRLSKYFIDARGTKPYFFDSEWEKGSKVSHWSRLPSKKPSLQQSYNQAHIPVRKQDKAIGHAVRAVYLYTAMADIAAETRDEGLLFACRALIKNIESAQMYITGGIGSTNHGEAFTFDFDLPNDTVYQETCASIGLIFFAHRMLKLEPIGIYGDILERTLYNSVVSGMGLDGKCFFYVNPMEVWPEASEKNPSRSHIKSVRQKWYGCACCPPNVSRLLSSLGQYIYTVNTDTLYTHLYISGNAQFNIGGENIGILQETNYPWTGLTNIVVSCPSAKEFSLAFRIPGWCKNATIKINGENIDKDCPITNGYAILNRIWKGQDNIELVFDMPVELIQSHPKVRANAGKLALQRGPLVYCLEEADNGENLSAITLLPQEKYVAVYDTDLLGGIVKIEGAAFRTDINSEEQSLYKPYQPNSKTVKITAVPYFMWGNRQPGEMLVWVKF